MSQKIAILYIFVFASAYLYSCGKRPPYFSLYKEDKKAFGTYIANKGIQSAFPEAGYIITDKSPYLHESGGQEGKAGIQDYNTGNGKVFFLIHRELKYLSKEEAYSLIAFAEEGNQLFLSVANFPEELEEALNLKVISDILNYPDSLSLYLLHPLTGDTLNFNYPAYNIDAYFYNLNSFVRNNLEILGWNRNFHPNFIKLNYPSGGAIFIHLAPAAFTNYFLLHKNNDQFLNLAIAHIPDNPDMIFWDEYFLYKYPQGLAGEFSALSLFKNHEILKWAYRLAIGILLSLVILETARRQRIIPVRKPIENTSLNFITTIGKLYFQNKNNNDIGYKMTLQFMDYARNKYQVSGNELNSDFIRRLSEKSGYDKKALEEIVYYTKLIKDIPNVSDELLLEYHQLIDEFYKYH